MHAVLQDPQLPARLVPWAAARPASVQRCLLLAVLLHLWLVLLLGNAPGGTAAPGQGVFGAINVTLRGAERPGQADTPPQPEALPIPTPTPLPAAPPAEAARWGGTVRQTEVPPELKQAGAERLGLPAPRQPEALPQPARATLPSAAPSPAPTPTPIPTPTPTPTPTPEPTPAPAERSLATALPAAAAKPAAALPRDALVPLASVPLAEVPSPGAGPAALRQLSAPPAPSAARAAEPALPRPVPAEALQLPRALPNPGLSINSSGAEAADAGTRVGHDVATPPTAAASQPPRLNLELARPRGGELSRFSTPGALPVLPRPPELDDKLARDIEKAGKTDCRKAYAGTGVLAVVPLVADAVKGSGCKW